MVTKNFFSTESIQEILDRLIMKYADGLKEVKLPSNFNEICERARINTELGLKFLVLSHLDPRLSDLSPEQRFEVGVSDGIFAARQRFGRNFNKKKEETDLEKIKRKIKVSSREYHREGYKLTPESIFESPMYSRWWKALYPPIRKKYGVFDEKVEKILFDYSIGMEIREEYDKHMYPYDTKYWIRMKRRK